MYAIVCFDRPDSASLRDANRAAHVAFLEKHANTIVFGGPLKNSADGASTGAGGARGAPSRSRDA